MDKDEQKKKLDDFMRKHGENPVRPSSRRQPSRQPKIKSRQPEVTAPAKHPLSETERLKREVRRLRASNDDKDDQLHQITQNTRNKRDDKAIAQMAHGHDVSRPENRFDKTYHLHYLNSDNEPVPYAMHIIMKPVTFQDVTNVNIQADYISRGFGKDFERNNFDLLTAFATMRVAGIKVPDAFKHPAKLNHIDILEMVYVDYLKWLASFRSHKPF